MPSRSAQCGLHAEHRSPEPASAQAMALAALQAWARHRDRLPDDRATATVLKTAVRSP
ncbi:hypothetical protein [Amycolatopsis sp. NPDC051372]|uniref:hypothetical protein n=1 Tax=Amycolatopsis sp. NPDC051372 TaxID=3155669 RepID=UPI003445306E